MPNANFISSRITKAKFNWSDMALDHTCAANFPSKRIRVKRMPHEEAEDCLLDASQGNHTGYYEAIDTMCSELMAHAA